MRKVIFLILAITFVANHPVFAADDPDDMLSLMSLTPGATTQQDVTSVYGRPVKVEESKKRSWWHYNRGNINLVICWNKKSDNLEKFSFSNAPSTPAIFDADTYKKLKSGTTGIQDALRLLGTPSDMTIKAATQEIHYTYRNNMLRLFFRDRVLVDCTLLSTVH